MTMLCHFYRLQTLGLPDGYMSANNIKGHSIPEIPLSESQTAEHGLQEGIGYQKCGHGTAIGDLGRQEIVWLGSITYPDCTPHHRGQSARVQYTE